MGSVVGEMDPALAEELGINYHDIKIVIGTHDQIAAGIGGAVDEPGVACNGIGTVDNILPIYTLGDVDVAENASHNYPLVPYMGDLFTTYAYIFDGGALTTWFKDVLGRSESHAAEVTGYSVFDILDKEAPEEPTQLLFCHIFPVLLFRTWIHSPKVPFWDLTAIPIEELCSAG